MDRDVGPGPYKGKTNNTLPFYHGKINTLAIGSSMLNAWWPNKTNNETTIQKTYSHVHHVGVVILDNPTYLKVVRQLSFKMVHLIDCEHYTLIFYFLFSLSISNIIVIAISPMTMYVLIHTCFYWCSMKNNHVRIGVLTCVRSCSLLSVF